MAEFDSGTDDIFAVQKYLQFNFRYADKLFGSSRRIASTPIMKYDRIVRLANYALGINERGIPISNFWRDSFIC